MKGIIAKIADGYGLHCLHKKYSRSDQFYFDKTEASILTSDYKKFYNKPSLANVNFVESELEKGYVNGDLRFLSEIDNGSSNINAIFRYNMCTDKDANINIILIHGWRASKLNRLEYVFLDRFIEKRYNMYRYILPFHMDRCPDTSLYSGEYFFSANVNRTLKSVQQSVSDIRALIRYIKEKRDGKIIIIGLSLGGLIANLLCQVEENIDMLISLFYANDLSFTAFETTAGKFIKEDFIKNNFDMNKLRECWSIINPSLTKPLIARDKILLVSGIYDKYVLKEDTDQLWIQWGKPTRYIYRCGHSGIVLYKNRIKDDILKFIQEKQLSMII